MSNIALSDELRRLIQTIESIPYLEAMLLMRQDGDHVWNEKTISGRLYLSPEIASDILIALYEAGICAPDATNSGVVYKPSNELADLIDQLSVYYSQHLIEVTNLVHAKGKSNRRARLFANAFLFKKED
jgi:hypothetical protein